MTRVVLGVALLASAAQAQVKVVGFAADHTLLYQASATQGAMVKLEQTRTPELVASSSSQWKTATKGVTATPSDSPGGKVMLALSVKLSTGKGTWGDGVYSWSVAPKKRPTGDEPQGHALLFVNDTMGQQGNALALDVPLRALTGKLTTYWEESGGFFAVLVEPASGPAEVLVGRGDLSATTVELLSTKDMDSAAQAVANQLWKDGRSIVRLGRALKPREQTVVFGAAANKEQAQAVADSISGGAAVETLTWKSDCQVVVGIGESAQQ